MYSEWRFKTPIWEGDIVGRLTPPPEYMLEMEQSIFKDIHGGYGDYSDCDQIGSIEEEDLLFDLEFKTICHNEFDDYKSGPTLAELNDTRSRSPLINPEMKRLHQAAILTGDVHKCETETKTNKRSVLEQQLKTQRKASAYHHQHLPKQNVASPLVSSSVSRSTTIAIPRKRDVELEMTGYPSPPSPTDRKPLSQDRKSFQFYHQEHNTRWSSKAPEFLKSLMENSGKLAVESLSNCESKKQEEAFETSVSLEQVASQPFSNPYTSENYDESEDEDEIDSEVDDIEDEYCPFQKEGKTPARRKGRKSESEDMVPNPSKLLHIGKELDRLNKVISSLKPINEVPQHSRGRSRREKNKLASRACRLKKKQQHEANKVKLHGLQSEQENLTFILKDMKTAIVKRAHYPRKPSSPLNEKFRTMAKKAFNQQVAGHTTEFVREVLQEVARGKKTGGLIIPGSLDT